MNPSIDDLQTDLNGLKEQARHLTAALADAAGELRERGLEPSSELIAEVQTYRDRFHDLRRRIAAWSGRPELRSESLLELDRSLSQALRVHSALTVITDAEQLQHAEGVVYSPLDRVRQDCSSLRTALQQETPASELVEALIDGRHPLAALVTLVAQSAPLTDERWEQLHDIVAGRFGRDLATAVARGRLRATVNAL